MERYDIAILGTGPAGVSAAITATIRNKKIILIGTADLSAKMTKAHEIQNYPGLPHIKGEDMAAAFKAHLDSMGISITEDRISAVYAMGEYFMLQGGAGMYEASAVILASGVNTSRMLPGEDEYLGRGVSYCATCDGNFYRNKVVAVVGGGNTALEDALFLTDIAAEVYLIHRRDSFRGEEANVARLKEKQNVHFIYNSTVTKLNAEKRLKSIELTNKNDGSVQTLEVNALFVAVGRIPENQNFANLVELDEAGYIPATEDCHTNVPGIFVAGDNRAKAVRQLVTAASDGAVAATEAVHYINGQL